ncbi:MAG: hypothetical protein R3C32_04045 [Chloroflexota bacterium]
MLLSDSEAADRDPLEGAAVAARQGGCGCTRWAWATSPGAVIDVEGLSVATQLDEGDPAGDAAATGGATNTPAAPTTWQRSMTAWTRG